MTLFGRVLVLVRLVLFMLFAFGRAVMLGMELASLGGVMSRMRVMAVSDMRMVRRLLVILVAMVRRRMAMMGRGLLVMVRRAVMMLGDFFVMGHGSSLRRTDCPRVREIENLRVTAGSVR